jgi:hypothetical protein
MDRKNTPSLTNERIKAKFGSSQFDLVNYAIKAAEEMILSGRESRVKSDGHNKALQILLEINQGKEKLHDLKVGSKED